MPDNVQLPTWVLVMLFNTVSTGIAFAYMLYRVGRWVERIEQRLENGGDLIRDWKEKAPGLLTLAHRVTALEDERADVKQIPLLKQTLDRIEHDMNGVRQALELQGANAANAARRAVMETLRPLADALGARLAA